MRYFYEYTHECCATKKNDDNNNMVVTLKRIWRHLATFLTFLSLPFSDENFRPKSVTETKQKTKNQFFSLERFDEKFLEFF